MSASDTLLALNIAVLTVSDTRNDQSDSSGIYLVESLQAAGHALADKQIVKDDIYQIRAVISAWIASPQVDAVLVTGGTGFSGGTPRPRQCRCCLTNRLKALAKSSALFPTMRSAPQQSSRAPWRDLPIIRSSSVCRGLPGLVARRGRH